MKPSTDGIQQWCVQAFDQFKKHWIFPDFWTRANTFDACLRFVTAAVAKWPDDPGVKKMATDALDLIQQDCDYFEGKVDDNLWVDDFGWCGNASLTAHTYLSTVSKDANLAARFLVVARTCARNLKQIGYDPAGKPVPGGCLNSSKDTPTDGVKNTVTNATFLLLSARLVAESLDDAPELTRNLANTWEQYTWFAAWCDTAQYGYFKSINGLSIGAVHERPHYPPDYMRTDHPTWQKGWVWSADQGLLMAGLVEFASVLRYPNVRTAFRSIAPGVDVDTLRASLVARAKDILLAMPDLFFDKDRVAQEAPFTSSFVDDPKDYVCGKGVLLRYLADVSGVLGANMAPYFVSTATRAWANADSGSKQFGPDWNPPKEAEYRDNFIRLWGYGDKDVAWGPIDDQFRLPIEQAAGLDALGAAIPFAK
jgi:hypothetical protein